MPQFKIGDCLVHKGQAEAVRLYGQNRGFKPDTPDLLTVVQIIEDTCPGGTQTSYACRAASLRGMSTELLKFNEVELSLAPTERLPEPKDD